LGLTIVDAKQLLRKAKVAAGTIADEVSMLTVDMFGARKLR
jgi:hypothetical protein